MDDRRDKRIQAGCCAIIVLVVSGLCFAHFHTHGESLRVAEHNWSRKIYIEQFKTVREQGSAVPRGGREIRSWLYVSSYVHVGKINVPIYSRKYEWDIDKWVVSYYMPTSGTGTNATWGDTSKLRTGNDLGCERAGAREETYWLVLRNDADGMWTHTLTEDRWRGVPDGERLLAHINDFGSVRWIDRMEAE